MTRRNRLLLSLLCLAPTFGCNFCAEDFSQPEPVRCDATDTEFDIDSIEVDGYQAFGGQGIEMIMFDVRYLGADPPTCAELEYTFRDLDSGNVVGLNNERVETQELRTGLWETTSAIWEPWPSGTSVLSVEVTSHGHESVDYVCRSGTLDCERLDGGFTLDAGGSDAGGSDAGELDAGGSDAGELDAGGSDAGELDAGGSDAGESDAGDSGL